MICGNIGKCDPQMDADVTQYESAKGKTVIAAGCRAAIAVGVG